MRWVLANITRLQLGAEQASDWPSNDDERRHLAKVGEREKATYGPDVAVHGSVR